MPLLYYTDADTTNNTQIGNIPIVFTAILDKMTSQRKQTVKKGKTCHYNLHDKGSRLGADSTIPVQGSN